MSPWEIHFFCSWRNSPGADQPEMRRSCLMDGCWGRPRPGQVAAAVASSSLVQVMFWDWPVPSAFSLWARGKISNSLILVYWRSPKTTFVPTTAAQRQLLHRLRIYHLRDKRAGYIEMVFPDRKKVFFWNFRCCLLFPLSKPFFLF